MSNFQLQHEINEFHFVIRDEFHFEFEVEEDANQRSSAWSAPGECSTPEAPSDSMPSGAPMVPLLSAHSISSHLIARRTTGPKHGVN